MSLLGRRRSSLAAVFATLASLAVLFAPASAIAHPLGNFTINHFAALRVAPERIGLDVVIDRAEIPAFQEQQRLDADGDGILGLAELEPERQRACAALVASLVLTVDGSPLAPVPTAAGLAVAPGAGDLPTMRLVCEFEAVLPARLVGGASITFEDRSFAERIGWREIVVLGDGVSIDGADATGGSGNGVSNRLTAYPSDLLTRPLDLRSVAFEAAPAGTAMAPWTAPDAQPLTSGSTAAGTGTGSSGDTGTTGGTAGVPGGITEDLAALIDVPDLNPLAVLVALAVAFGLGVVHAVSPGHGKTIMAAYLVGGRGSTRQAVGLGLAVAVSHTLGVMTLAVITLAASSILPPERLYPILGLASGALVVVIGGSLLLGRIRAMRGYRHDSHGHSHSHREARAANGHSHPQDDAPPAHAHSEAHGHGHPRPHDHALPDAGISWRGLVALGLSGGLVPSASALILLLGSIAAGLPAYGLVLVVAFGAGMAVVLGGIGFLLVHARGFLERRPAAARFERLVGPVQLATASLVVVLGAVLTGQALAQVL